MINKFSPNLTSSNISTARDEVVLWNFLGICVSAEDGKGSVRIFDRRPKAPAMFIPITSNSACPLRHKEMTERCGRWTENKQQRNKIKSTHTFGPFHKSSLLVIIKAIRDCCRLSQKPITLVAPPFRRTSETLSFFISSLDHTNSILISFTPSFF